MGEWWSSNNGSNEGDLGKAIGRQSSRTKKNSKKGANAAFLNANIEQAIEETSANQELWTDVDKIKYFLSLYAAYNLTRHYFIDWIRTIFRNSLTLNLFLGWFYADQKILFKCIFLKSS